MKRAFPMRHERSERSGNGWTKKREKSLSHAGNKPSGKTALAKCSKVTKI
jgi:hypothetical protein